MSAMDRSMIAVEIGSSTAAPANPVAPPAAPVAVTTALWNQSQELPSVSLSNVSSAPLSAVDSDAATIFVRPSWMDEGSNSTPCSITPPTALEGFVANDRLSSKSTAACSFSKSLSENPAQGSLPVSAILFYLRRRFEPSTSNRLTSVRAASQERVWYQVY